MAIKHQNVSIRRDELTTLRVTVAAWEVPLLHLVHREGAVQDLPGEPWADVDPPNVVDEYQRLANKYRSPPDDDGRPGQSPVAAVYGPFGASPLLKQAIEAAVIPRPTDLLGLDILKAAAAKAAADSKAANDALANAEAASGVVVDDLDDEGEDEPAETPAQKRARLKAEKAAAAAAAAATPASSLL